MNSRPLVIVYKRRNRDISALEQVCSDLNYSLKVCEGEEGLRAAIEKGVAIAIIVPLGSEEEGTRNARDFASTLESILQPEDPDLLILYSTEEFTPDDWSEPDPRLTRLFGADPGTLFIPDDKAWRHTIQRLRALPSRPRLERNPRQRTLTLAFSPADRRDSTPTEVPFPTEVRMLLRSAFKDMSRIEISFPRQGLSGSLAFYVKPYDSRGTRCKQFFAKVFPESAKAFDEYKNYLEYVENYLTSDCYPPVIVDRRYQGTAYSLFVTELVEGPDSKAMTFRDVLQSTRYKADQIEAFILTALQKMDKRWESKEESVDLLEKYLGATLKKEDRVRKLESENRFNTWFGNCADGMTFEQKVRSSLPPRSLEGRHSKICHGDLHIDNMMAGGAWQTLAPIFIDFSRTGESHSLKDLVTIESDLIIRGVQGVQEVNSPEQFNHFLQAIPFGENDRRAERLPTILRNKRLVQKVLKVIAVLRNNAISVHRASEVEYLVASLLKTLEVLSYGKLPYDRNERAALYVTFMLYRIRQLTSSE